MVALLIRPTGLDAALMQRFLSPLARQEPGTVVVRPRLVVNADLVGRNAGFALAARQSGVPLLVDPRTSLLQFEQYPTHRWAQLPFADNRALAPADFNATRIAEIAEQSLQLQVEAEATAIIAPYFHVSRVDDGWTSVQRRLMRATRAAMDRHHVGLPFIAVIDLWWPLLSRPAWAHVLTPLLRAAVDVGCAEIGLAGSYVDAGARPQDRAAALVEAIRRCRSVAPTLAWNQGVLGELCVAAGAIGYGTGIGWGERCNTPAMCRQQRTEPAPSSPRAPRPILVPALERSIPRRSIERLADHRQIAPDLPCPAPASCCPDGVDSLLRDARAHTLRARVRSLRELDQVDPAFRWRHLQDHAEAGLSLAARINVQAAQSEFARVDTSALRAISDVAAHLQRHRRRKAA